MPIYEFEFDGRRYEVEAPDRDSAISAFRSQIGGQQEAVAQDERPGFMEFVNQGIAQGLGSPVDLSAGAINLGISGANLIPGVDIPHIEEPFGGSRSIMSGLGSVGVPVAPADVAPEGIVENMAAGLGGATGFLVPYTGLSSALSRVPGLAGDVGRALTQPFIDAPRRALASELMAGAGAGAGMGVAEIADPDGPISPLVGALAGGALGGLSPYAASRIASRTPLVGGAVRFAQSEIAPFTQGGAMERARNRMRNLVSDPEGAIASINEPSIGGLTPAEQTGDRRLLALQRAVMDTDPVADQTLTDQAMRTNVALRDAVRGISGGTDPNISRMYLSGAMEDQIGGVGPTLDRALGVPAGTYTAEADIRMSSAPARDQAYREAWEAPIDYSSDQWRNLARVINRVEAAAPGTINRANQLIAGDLDAARPGPIRTRSSADGSIEFVENPTTQQIDYISRALRGMAQSGEGQGALGGQTDLGRMYTNLSGEIRRSLREVNPAYATALDTAAAPIAQREALLLGEEMLNPNVARDYISDQVSGMTGPEIDFVRQGVRSSLDEMLANVRSTLSTPDVGSAQAQALLRDMTAPAMRQKLSLIMPDDELNSLFRDLDATRELLDPRRSGAAIFTSGRPGEEIRGIINAQNPGEAAAQLVRQAEADPSGQALSGIKRAFLDNLMDAETREGMVSGAGLIERLSNPRMSQVAEQILSPDEMSNFRRIADEFSRLEASQSNLPPMRAVMEGEPNSLVSLLVRSVAARQGARAGRGTSGASLLTANFASQRANRILQGLTLDRAEALIREAILGDRELMEALLSPGGPTTDRQINALSNALVRASVGAGGAAQGMELGPFDATWDAVYGSRDSALGEALMESLSPANIPQITVQGGSDLARALMEQ